MKKNCGQFFVETCFIVYDNTETRAVLLQGNRAMSSVFAYTNRPICDEDTSMSRRDDLP